MYRFVEKRKRKDSKRERKKVLQFGYVYLSVITRTCAKRTHIISFTINDEERMQKNEKLLTHTHACVQERSFYPLAMRRPYVWMILAYEWMTKWKWDWKKKEWSLCFECVCVCVSRACAILSMRMESHSIQIVYTHRCVFTSSVRLPYCVEKRNDGCQLHTLTLFPSTVVARAVCVCVRVRS